MQVTNVTNKQVTEIDDDAAGKKRTTYPRIRDLEPSPDLNPLIQVGGIQIKKKMVRSGNSEELINIDTGEVRGLSVVHMVEEKDDAQFVKVFAEGIAASYDLSKAGQRVFQVVLGEYERTPMYGGYADAVDLYWQRGGLAGRDVGMSEATFNRGMRELLHKDFLYPRTPTAYWVNPALFFKGNRVLFIKEYVRKTQPATRPSLQHANKTAGTGGAAPQGNLALDLE